MDPNRPEAFQIHFNIPAPSSVEPLLKLGNKMKKIIKPICAVLAAMLLQGYAEARIGANPEECKAAYGTVREVRPDGSKISYRKDGVMTDCWFLEGVCEAVSYHILPGGMVDIPAFGGGPRFSKEQSMALLNLNRGASTWSQESKAKYGEDYDGIYATADGKFRASVSSVGVAVESVTAIKLWKGMINEQALSATITSFSPGAPSGPKILQDAPLPPPTQEELEAQRNAARIERNIQDMKRIQKDFQKVSSEIDNVLTKVAARVAKKEEIQRHKDAFKEIEETLMRSRTDVEKAAAKEKEAEWIATANRLISEYEALKADVAKDK